MNERRHRAARRTNWMACIAFGAIAMGASAYAADCTSNGAGQGGSCQGVTVTTLYVESGVSGTNGGNVYLMVNGAMAPLGCTLDSGYVTLPKSAPSFNANYAALLTAQVSKAPFELRVLQGDNGKCVVAYVALH
jgi:hypothetical protein